MSDPNQAVAEQEVQEAPQEAPAPELPDDEVLARRQMREEQNKAKAARTRYLEEQYGLPAGQLDQWKTQYGKIFSAHILGQPYVWRGLRRQEFTQLMNASDVKDIENPLDARMMSEERVVKRGLLYPDPRTSGLSKGPAGVLTTLSNHILNASGFDLDDVPVEL